MSRIGKKPIAIPQGVTVTVDKNNLVKVKGSKGELIQKLDPDMKVKIEEGELLVERPSEQKRHKALHGLYRSLINNMVVGVSEGYKIELEIVGVGFKAACNNNILDLNLGYSHNIYFALPPEVKGSAETKKGSNPSITLESIDKQLIGQVAAKIKALRKVEPYKGKGVRLKGQVLGVDLRKKAGKTAAKK